MGLEKWRHVLSFFIFEAQQGISTTSTTIETIEKKLFDQMDFRYMVNGEMNVNVGQKKIDGQMKKKEYFLVPPPSPSPSHRIV